MEKVTSEQELERVDTTLTNLDPALPTYFETYENYSDIHRYLVRVIADEALVTQVEVVIT